MTKAEKIVQDLIDGLDRDNALYNVKATKFGAQGIMKPEVRRAYVFLSQGKQDTGILQAAQFALDTLEMRVNVQATDLCEYIDCLNELREAIDKELKL